MTETQILIESIVQAIAAGLFVGAIYGLMCVGLAMIFGIMRVINFAQGDLMMLGMYAAYFAFVHLGIQAAFGVYAGPYVAALLAAPALYIFGWAVHRLLIRLVTGIRTASMEAEGHYAQLILTLGIALILQNGAMILFGSELISVRTPLSSAAWFIPLGDVMAVFLN
ncbi:MAG: branched-chain amino acid ABC transporter permease, partial [Phyllobacteriaceae bacterium]|nr:branched-chain amino acid ABC transporter permease [Phyllobacteriaceae bacterium]